MSRLVIYDVENNPIRDTDLLHPLMYPGVTRMQAILADLYSKKLTPTNFQLFETWRHPLRQRALGQKTIAAKAWTSAHQYGLAADFVPFVEGKSWDWGADHDWGLLKRVAREVGLSVPVNGDPGHIEHPRWSSIRAFMR